MNHNKEPYRNFAKLRYGSLCLSTPHTLLLTPFKYVIIIVMKFVHAFIGYLGWHYSSAYVDMVRVWKNFLWFIVHFFSIPTLAGSLFAPLNRLDEGYKKGDTIEGKAETLIANTLVRFIGFILRSFLIVLGLVMLLGVLIGGLVGFVIWTLAPLLVLGLIVFAISFL